MSVEDLRRIVATAPVIEQAKGMLMGYYGINAAAAFQVLIRWSRNSNTKIRELCAGLVDAAAADHDEPFGALRAFLRDQQQAETFRHEPS